MKMLNKVESKILTIPNIISLIRLLLLVPLVLILQHIEDEFIFRIYALVIILLMGISDGLDGYLARKLNQITEFGKMIDPISDKLIIAVIGLFMFLNNEITPAYFILLILRDIYIITGSWFITSKIHKVLPSTLSGKISVVLTGLFLTWCIIDVNKDSFFYNLLFYSSISMLAISTLVYTLRGLDALKHREKFLN